MQVIFGADHGSFEVKEFLQEQVRSQTGWAVEDLGAWEHQPQDNYAVFGRAVGERVSELSRAQSAIENPQVWGVLACRSGGGIAIAANRFPGVRAVVCRSFADVEHARTDDNANILVLEGDVVQPEQAWEWLQSFVATPFKGGRHEVRVLTLA